MTSPAPDTGRTAEEMRALLADCVGEALVAAGPGMAIGVGVFELVADRLLSGPLAPILQEAATARKERDEARHKIQQMVAWANSATQVADSACLAEQAAEANLIALAKMYGEACRDLVYARSGEDDLFWQKEEAVVALSRNLATAEAEAAHLRAENANLRDRVREAEKGDDFWREVLEGSSARWREAARMAVNGDPRRLQRLLSASRSPIVGSSNHQEAGDHEPR